MNESLIPSNQTLLQISTLLHETFMDHLESIDMTTLDESVIGYEPKKAAKEKANKEGGFILFIIIFSIILCYYKSLKRWSIKNYYIFYVLR